MTPFRSVAAYTPPGAVALGLGTAAAVFRARPGVTTFDMVVCSDVGGPLTTDLGISVVVEHDLSALATADLVLVLPGGDSLAPPSKALVSALRAAHRRGAILAAHCAGVLPLAATGLLDGREATTHWQYAAELAGRHPAVTVRSQALYLDQGDVVTGAGAAAGMDLYLYLVRREHGAALANTLARLLVVPPHRDGGQLQFVDTPVPADADGERLAEVIGWARSHLEEQLSIDVLAARALMSRRTFLRRFKAATGATPHAWLLTQRLALAEDLLETTDMPVEQIAHQIGYTGAAVLRERFVQRRGVTPSDYRRTFGTGSHQPATAVHVRTPTT